MKKLSNLKGAKTLSKKEQQSINGGKRFCEYPYQCAPGEVCVGHVCVALS